MVPSPNGIGTALGLLGDEWSLLVVREQLLGARRFGELQRRLGIGPAVLSARLSSLVAGDVLEPEPDGGYRLTRAGRELWRLLLCVWAWEQQWVQGEVLPTMRHRTCGAPFTPVLGCGCGAAVERADVEVALGPAGELGRSLPTGARRRRTGSGRADGPGLFPETMALIGSRWSSALLGACLLGSGFRESQRFSDLEVLLGAPPGVLADRLRQFVDLGVLDPSYRLTPKGLGFFPAVVALVSWGERWHPAPDGPALVATHAGHAFVPRLRCSSCGAGLRYREVEVVSA